MGMHPLVPQSEQELGDLKNGLPVPLDSVVAAKSLQDMVDDSKINRVLACIAVTTEATLFFIPSACQYGAVWERICWPLQQAPLGRSLVAHGLQQAACP
jgi:hypothetical protein